MHTHLRTMHTCRVWPAQELALMLLGEPSARPESQSRSVASEAPFVLGCLAKAVNLGRTSREDILQVGRGVWCLRSRES